MATKTQRDAALSSDEEIATLMSLIKGLGQR